MVSRKEGSCAPSTCVSEYSYLHGEERRPEVSSRKLAAATKHSCSRRGVVEEGGIAEERGKEGSMRKMRKSERDGERERERQRERETERE
jgi:hypothetical protein